jgi:predicted helicase
MLMPYYISALNIEHAYLELTGKYEPFEGLWFVDTLDLAEDRQIPMFAERNTQRVSRGRRAPFHVGVGEGVLVGGRKRSWPGSATARFPGRSFTPPRIAPGSYRSTRSSSQASLLSAGSSP